MRKGRKLAPAAASPASAYYPATEEAKARFRHQSLLQDYEDLLKETAAKKKKLQKAKQIKLKLAAEVRFLKRKYKCLSQNPSGLIQIRLNKRMHSSTSSQLFIGQPSNASFQVPAKDQLSSKLRDGAAPSTSGVIDLNQVSLPIGEDMDGYQVDLEPAKTDKPMKSSIEGDTVASDLKLSICRDVGLGANPVAKRKITWQDQVALRV